MAAVAVRRSSVRWVTADEEVEVTTWEALAAKLKAAAAKKNATETTHRYRALNALGADGWELVSHQRGETRSMADVWTFKRRVKK